MKQSNAFLNSFLNVHTIDDIKAEVVGELNEYATDKATYFFGNGELIISPADESQDEITYVVDRIGFNSMLVRV